MNSSIHLQCLCCGWVGTLISLHSHEWTLMVRANLFSSSVKDCVVILIAAEVQLSDHLMTTFMGFGSVFVVVTKTLRSSEATGTMTQTLICPRVSLTCSCPTDFGSGSQEFLWAIWTIHYRVTTWKVTIVCFGLKVFDITRHLRLLKPLISTNSVN